jgi:hypothetical protein
VLPVAKAQGLPERRSDQQPVIVARDGLQPDMGREGRWVRRAGGSGAVRRVGATEDAGGPLVAEAASICWKRAISAPV